MEQDRFRKASVNAHLVAFFLSWNRSVVDKKGRYVRTARRLASFQKN